MKPNEMIESYIAEFGALLPKKGRADIQRELQSLIQDGIDSRLGSDTEGDDQDVSAKLVSEVLLEFGSPEQMALQYRGDRYLIGPKLFPLFKLVTSIVFTVLTCLHILAFLISYWGVGSINLFSPGSGIVEAYIRSIGFSFAIITVVFGLIEWYYGSDFAPETETEAWEPSMLEPKDDPDRVKRFELITGIVFAIVGLGVGLSLIAPGGMLAWLFTESFKALIPLFIISAGVDILLKGLLIWKNRWNVWLRWFEIATTGISIYVIYRATQVFNVVTLDGFNSVINLVLNGILFILVIVLLIQLSQQVWRWRFGSNWSWKDMPDFSTKSI